LRPYYLLDTSALARRYKPAVQPKLTPLIEAQLVARCTITDLEAGIVAESPARYQRTWAHRAPWLMVEIDQAVLDRASEVQGQLADRSQHRRIGIADLIIAAAAEHADLIVLHYHRDYERIAELTRQATERIVPAGDAD
jgi:predicted nucleic acid-binding protein